MPRVNPRNRNKGKVDENGKPLKPNWEWRFEAAKIDGKRQQMSKAGFKTKKEAEIAGAKALAEYQSAGKTFTPSEISVSDYMDEWFEKYCLSNVKYNSQIIYSNTIKNYVKPRIGKYKLGSVNPAVLQEFIDKLGAEGHAKNNIEQIKSMLSAAFNYAVYPLQYMKDNPMRFVKIPKKARDGKEKMILTIEQYNKLLERFPADSRHHIPIKLAFHCGLRTGEVCGMTWDDIDFEKKTITVNKQSIRIEFEKGDVGFIIGEPKTKSSNRTISFDNVLLDALKKEKARQERNEQKLQRDYNVHALVDTLDPQGNEVKRIVTVTKELADGLERMNFVCVNDCGKFTSNDTVKYIARVAKNKLEMPEFDFHSLRHTHATMLVEQQMNIKNVQHRLGHDDVKTTLNAYVKNTRRMDEDAAKVFEIALGK